MTTYFNGFESHPCKREYTKTTKLLFFKFDIFYYCSMRAILVCGSQGRLLARRTQYTIVLNTIRVDTPQSVVCFSKTIEVLLF